MVRFVERLPRETIVIVHGVLKEPVEPVKSADTHKLEVDIKKVRGTYDAHKEPI